MHGQRAEAGRRAGGHHLHPTTIMIPFHSFLVAVTLQAPVVYMAWSDMMDREGAREQTIMVECYLPRYPCVRMSDGRRVTVLGRKQRPNDLPL